LVGPLLAIAGACSRESGDLLDGFRTEAVDREAPTPYELVDRAYEAAPESREGDQEMALAFTRQGEDRWLLEYTLSGLLDDAIMARQVRIEIVGGEELPWRAVRRGERWKCRRAASPSWTFEPCP
jgi:hypothetical protein